MKHNRITVLIATAIVGTLNIKHAGYETHWWWDNLGHFCSGFILGMLIPTRERETYFVIAMIWEYFEYRLARMSLWERYPVPAGPRSMGFSEWDFDHQVEDTILDTLMGYYGVKLALRIKGAKT